MKCESCGSSWESRQHLDKCPFCGSLLNKNLDLDSNFSNTLKMVLNQYGVEILKEKKFISILKDYVPNETKKNELMNIFVTKDVGRKFVEMYFEKNSEWVNIYDYCVKCLTEDAFIGHEFACMIMDEIGEALNLTHQTQAYILDKKQDIKEISIDEIPKINNDELLYGYLQEKETLRTKNLRECIELYTWHCGDMCFSLKKKIDNYWNTTFDIVILNENNEMYDDNIDVRTILKAIELFRDKNNKSYNDPDKEQIGRFLLDEKTKYESIAKKPRNKKNIEIVTMSKPDPYSKRPQYTVKHIITDERGQAFCHSETTYAMIDWSGEMGRRIPIQKDSLNPKKINGYVFVTMVSSNEEPEEGKLVPSGTLIKLYYKKVKNGTNKDGFIKTSSETSVEKSDIEDFTINNSTLVKYNGSEKNVVIPDGVTIIGKEAFCNCRSVESVAFPLSLKMIEARAFASCTSLRGTLELPESLLQIGRSAFYGCSSIKKLEFPTRLEHIGKAAFGDCKSIKGVVLLPDSVISIGKHAFYGCDSIQLIVVPEGVQKISEQSLDVSHVVSKYEYVTKCISKDKSDIDAILAKEGRKLIETCYFVEYIKLDEDGYETCEMRKTYTGISWATNQNAPIMIRKNSLEQKKFRGYSYSETNSDKGSVSEGEYVPSGTVIKLYYKKNSFEFEYDGNTLVKYHGHESNVVIPERVTVIGREAFCKCEFIKTVKFPSSLQKIEGRAFASCSSLQGPLLLPESLVQIGRGAFYGCSSLSAVKFPTGLKYIGQAAFCECSALKGTISIPKSVISIGNNAFFGCDSIQLNRMPNDEKETDEVEKLFY